MQPDDEGILGVTGHPLEHGLLSKRVLEFLVRQHMALGDRLERVDVAFGFVAHEQHLARASLAEHANHLKVVNHDLLGLARLARCLALAILLARSGLASALICLVRLGLGVRFGHIAGFEWRRGRCPYAAKPVSLVRIGRCGARDAQ